jgi:indole-3-glycerol phosphate synthase
VADLLQTILAATARVVAERKLREPAGLLEMRAHARLPDAGGFRAALAAPDRINVIAECKRRSPSRGVLKIDYDAVAIAVGYEQAGAAALSVLTEPTFFDGSLDHLAAVRAAVSLPLLRKDFVIDSYQLLEARANGADAVLLIVAALADAPLARLHREADALGLAVLVEAHDAEEVERAVGAGAEIIGINNRNLRTLAVDIDASFRAAERIPTHVIGVSESGLKTGADLARMQALGYRAFLIGERLMTAPAPGDALRALLTSLAGNGGSPSSAEAAR